MLAFKSQLKQGMGGGVVNLNMINFATCITELSKALSLIELKLVKLSVNIYCKYDKISF